MNNEALTVRQWLRLNGYSYVADMIDEIMVEWSQQGKKKRRNWWEVLAGGKNGEPRTIAGRTFPVLRAAQARQRKPITQNSINAKNDENPSLIRKTNRWPNRD